MTMTTPKVMCWLREHLVDFPIPYMANQLEQNGCADFKAGSALVRDHIQATEDQAKRAQGVLDAFQAGFDGKEGMNTLLCVLYSPQAVSSLVRAAYADADDSNRLAHVFVLRVGEVFIMLLTASPYKRFPLEQFMKLGEHTSAFMWVNLKEACWEPYTTTDSLAVVLKPAKKKQKVWQQLSHATLCGLHVLSVLWRRAVRFPAVPAVQAGVGAVMNHHVYVQPPQKALTVVDGDDQPTVAPDAWVLEIERFADQFTNSPSSNTVVEAPLPPPLVVDEVGEVVGEVVAVPMPVVPVVVVEVVEEAMAAPLVVEEIAAPLVA